jgi:hypothetical protein
LNKKRRQHYVWQMYLKNWLTGSQLHCFSKKEMKSFKASPINVALERDFYRLVEITRDEYDWLTTLIPSEPDELKRMCFLLLNISLISPLHPDVKTKELVQSNALEDAHSRFEEFGKRLISINNFNDLQALVDFNRAVEPLIFISLQYLRTKKMKDRMLQAVKDKDTGNIDYVKINHLTTFFLSLRLSVGLCVTGSAHFCLLRSNEDEKFITSDQPTINIKDEELDEEGNTKAFELFYPLSPDLALLICANQNDNHTCEEKTISKEEVENWNFELKKRAHNFIFALKEFEIKKTFANNK